MSTTLQHSMQDASSPAQTKIVILNGEIDESNQAELESLFSKLLSDSSIKNIVFQINNLEYINSSIIGIFAQQHGNFSEAGKNFVFAQANEHIFDIIDLVGLTAVVECFDSVNEACLSFED
jgi:stage II sporulation protein AA (anti-sigma F factor antagonist)